MTNRQNGDQDDITKAFRSKKRPRTAYKTATIVKVEARSRSASPVPAQFADSFVDAFRYAGPSTRSTSRPFAPPVKKEELEESALVEVLTGVPDYVKEDMDLLIVGSNPGRMSSQKAQHFAHPSNHFYRTLHGSALTPNLVPANFDHTMLDQERPFYSIGLTNLAARPTRMAHELDQWENAEGAKILLALIRRYRPRLACFIGIGVARAFEKSLGDVTDMVKKDDRRARKKHQRDADDHAPVTVTIPSNVPTTDDKDMGLGVGLMTIAVRHNWDVTKVENQQNGCAPPYTLLFASPSTSGRVTSHQLPQKTECMRRVRILLDYWEQGERLAATRDVAITLI